MAVVVGTLVVFAASGQPQHEPGFLPQPTDRVSDSSAGFLAQLDYFIRANDTLLVFDIGRTGRPIVPLPSLSAQGFVLDRMLGVLATRHPDLPDTLAVRLGASRTGLVEALDRKLAQPGADWDGAHGRPRHGQFGEVLQTTLEDVVAHSALAQAFTAHGYRLSLTGMNRTDIDPVPALGGAKLPTDITIMQFEARRLPRKG